MVDIIDPASLEPLVSENFTVGFDEFGEHSFYLPGASVLSEGMYHLRVMIYDYFGRSGGDVEVWALVIDDTPPVAEAGPDQEADMGDTVTFNGSASTDDNFIANYTWYFGDGEVGYGEVVEHAYYAPGFYSVMLEVFDAAGDWYFQNRNRPGLG